MERIAIISDIHGNITALEAALEDIKRRNIDRIFCLGDMVIKCSSPFECVEKTFENCEVILKGNCENRAVEDPRITEHYWNKDKLSDEQKEKIKKLPLYYDFYMSGLKIRLMHATPNTFSEKSTFWSFDSNFNDRIKSMFEGSEFFGNVNDNEKIDVIIFGHIHRTMMLRTEDNKTLINPGAISNSSEIVNLNGKDYTYGSYLIIEGEYKSKEYAPISYNIVKFTYDNTKEAEKIKNTDMPNKEVAALEILTGKYFDRKNIYLDAHKKENKI